MGGEKRRFALDWALPMAHPNEELLRRFYDSFRARDAEGMIACYAPAVRFRDPAFGDLEGDRARGMWRMLCSRAKDLRVECSGIVADGQQGTAHWEAWYTFGAAGRPVHNVIDATFRFEGGLITQHHDHFDFHRWSRQALGLPGLLLGWAPFFRKSLQARANQGLDGFLKR
jgi:hypothetical protein